MNKNISVWRGSTTPPTNYHLWIQDDNSIYLHNGTEWDPIIDPDAFENLKDYLEHEKHSPKINLTSTIPDDSNLNDKEFKLFNVTGDLSITSPAKFGRDENFIALDGDIYLQGKIKGKADSLVSEVNPCLTGSFDAKKINIVFKNGDYEIGVNKDGYVKTVHRLTEPTWEILRTYGEFYKIKHIKTDKYLSYSNGIYTISTGYTLFLFISKNSSIRSFEILRDGSNQCINMKSGSGWNYDISEWTKGDTNNELFIIDPSTFVLPKITPMLKSKEPYEYKINFIQDKSYYFGGNESYNGASVLVKPEEKAYKFTFLGTYDNLTITRNELGNETTPPYCLKMDDVLVCGYNKGVFQLRPCGYESNQQFILIPLGYELALNPFRGISENNVIKTYNRNDVNNTVRFIPCEKNWVINRIISTQCATNVHDGLMSASDKAKLDLFQAASNYKTKQSSKSSPTASSSTAYLFIDTITQDSNGVITATKKTVRTVSQSQSGLMSTTDKKKLDGLATVASSGSYTDLSNKPTKLSEFSDDLNITNTLTKLSWSQTSVSTSLSSIVVYPGTLVTVTATMTSAFMDTVDKIEIKYNNNVVKLVSNSNLTTYTASLTEAKDHVFTSYITSGELTKEHSATLSVRNPVYVGVGTTVSNILVDSNKLSARKSAVSTYEKTITQTGLSFYLLVPNDVTAPKEFSVGGAPVDIEQSTTTINNVTYKVFKTRGTYNANTKLTISTK